MDIEWLAGYLEAEGSFQKGPPSAPRCPRILVTSTDRDTIERVSRIFHVTYIHERDETRRSPLWKVSYSTLSRGRRAVDLMRSVFPLMGNRRRRQIIQAIECYDAAEAPRLDEAPRLTGITLEWLSGYLEGEGSFLAGPPSRPNRPAIQIWATDEDVIQRIADHFDVSYYRYDRPGGTFKTAYHARIRGRRAVALMKELHLMMGERRREQIDRVLESYVADLTGGIRGAHHPNARLTAADVHAIRSRLATGESAHRIARDYDVSGSSIRDIECGRSWRWLKD